MINSLKKNKLTITLADKNIGIVIIDTYLYNNLCFEHLNNDVTYDKIDFNPQFKIFQDTKDILYKLNEKGHISNRLFKSILQKIKNKKFVSFDDIPSKVADIFYIFAKKGNTSKGDYSIKCKNTFSTTLNGEYVDIDTFYKQNDITPFSDKKFKYFEENNKNIRILGHVENQSNYYNIFDICIFMSRWETFGYTLIEAMKFKIPIISSVHVGNKDWLKFFNVLKGDMSLIGPRPLLLRYLPYYTDKERLRHSVRPGITGLAQINGRNSVKWDERLAFDVEYVKSVSLKIDIKILYKTLLKIIVSEGIVVDPESIMKNLDDERGV